MARAGAARVLRRAHALLLLPLLLTACPAPSGPDATLAGQDRNANGVRDDVERAIRAKYRPSELPPVMNVARTLQALLLTDPVTGQPAVAAARYFAASSCVDDTLGFRQMVEVGHTVEALTINTRLRSRAYERLQRSMSGAGFSGDTTACRASR